MPDPPRELAELADRVEGAVADGTMASERAVQLRAAEPLIEVLGWDVRGDGVRPAETIDDRLVDYLLTIDAIPAIAVQTVGPDEEIERAVDSVLEPLLERGETPRGIATDGRRVTLHTTDGSGVYDYACPFSELHEHADALGQFHRSTLEATVADEQASRRDAAKRLADESEAVADAIAGEILSVTGTDVAESVRTATDRFVEDLVDDLTPGDANLVEDDISAESTRTAPSGVASVDDHGSAESDAVDDRSGSESSGDVPDEDPPDGTPPNGAAPSRRSSSLTDSDGSGARASDTVAGEPVGGAGSHSQTGDGSDPDGSYVARFFGGSSSVGAVGTATPRSTTVGVVRYLLENHELHRAVTFPWEVEPGEPVVTDSRPNPEWISLGNPEETEVFVRPIDDSRAAKATIEALADAVGLRVMFQGDW